MKLGPTQLISWSLKWQKWNIMSNSLPPILVSQMKWTNSLKNMIYQKGHKEKEIIQIDLYLLKKLKQVITSPKQKERGPNGFTVLPNTSRKIPVFYNLIQKQKQREYFITCSITLIPNPNSNITRERKLQTDISHEHGCKHLQQNVSN